MLKMEPITLSPITKPLTLQCISPKVHPLWKIAKSTSGYGYKATTRSAKAKLTTNALPRGKIKIHRHKSVSKYSCEQEKNVLLYFGYLQY